MSPKQERLSNANYLMSLFRPGFTYNKKGEPVGNPPELSAFEANSPTEALNLALRAYESTGLGTNGHFNVELRLDERN